MASGHLVARAQHSTPWRINWVPLTTCVSAAPAPSSLALVCRWNGAPQFGSARMGGDVSTSMYQCHYSLILLLLPRHQELPCPLQREPFIPENIRDWRHDPAVSLHELPEVAAHPQKNPHLFDRVSSGDFGHRFDLRFRGLNAQPADHRHDELLLGRTPFRLGQVHQKTKPLESFQHFSPAVLGARLRTSCG